MPATLPTDPKPESALLLATREKIRTGLSLGNGDCEIELDEIAPATVGALYVAILPAGVTFNAEHATSGGAISETYSVQVIVIIRAGDVPADRMREKYLWNANALNERVNAVLEVMDYSHPWPAVMTRANELVASGSFIEPLRATRMDQKPRQVHPEMFRSNGREVSGLARSIVFGGAKFMRNRTLGA